MSKPVKRVHRYRLEGDQLIETIKLTPILLMNLSKHNGMNNIQISQALARGERIYTSFSYYEKADLGEEPL